MNRTDEYQDERPVLTSLMLAWLGEQTHEMAAVIAERIQWDAARNAELHNDLDNAIAELRLCQAEKRSMIA